MQTLRRVLLPLLLIVAVFAVPRPGLAQVAVSITVAPPPLPVYVQPVIPGPGWIWAPGYWAWGPYGYYWVPGTWVRPPRIGLLWTPGWWGWADGVYVWHVGYWGPHVGFYGGINYGFGYFGVGYAGGYWDHDRFFYNRDYNNIRNVHITNVYNRTVVVNNVTRVSFNGGRSGLVARPTAEEERFAREPHVRPTALQVRHDNAARTNPALRSSVNHGHPHIAATTRPGAFTGRGVVHAQGSTPYHPQRHAQPQRAVRQANQPGPRGPAPQHGQAPQGGPQPQGEPRHQHEGGGQGGPGGPPGGGGNPERHP